MPDPQVTGNILNVCPSGCTYNLPSQALAKAVDGDTIKIQAGTYPDCSPITQNNIIIQGVPDSSGNLPHIISPIPTCGRKGIFIVDGTNTLIENLELSGAVDPGYGDYNWAGIRFDTTSPITSRNLKVRNCYIHNNDDGLLGNNDPLDGTPNLLDIESSHFELNGRGGYAHSMYVGSGITKFALRNSVVDNNIDDGHLVKSRALTGLLECNTIAALNGLNSYAVDLPQGGTYTVQNNVIEQGPHINNGGDYFINFAEENQNNAPHKILVAQNWFINDYTNPGQIQLLATPDTSGWSGNQFAGTGGQLTLNGYVGPNSFQNFSTRQAAGLPAYDGTLSSLPARPVCP